jgi:aryl-alcohol dehydrogenase-like predicted oxidoreductase
MLVVEIFPMDDAFMVEHSIAEVADLFPSHLALGLLGLILGHVERLCHRGGIGRKPFTWLHFTNSIPNLKPSFLILGTANYGVTSDEVTSFALLDAYLELGGNMIDTARCYSDWVPGETGRSENLIGRWLKARGCREHVLISTKGGHPPMDDFSTVRMSRAQLMADVEASRRALGVDTIDLYWLHRDDINQPVEALLETLELFREKGWIERYGASNFSTKRLESARVLAQHNNWLGFSANQPMGCLGARYREPMEIPLLEVIDDAMETFHATHQLPLFPYTAQAVGYYEKVDRLGHEHPSLSSHPFNTPHCNQIAKQLGTLARNTNSSISALVLAWWRTKPFDVHPIVGCRTLQQLKDSFGSLDISNETIDQLRRI